MRPLILAALGFALLGGCASQMAEPGYYRPAYYGPRPDYGPPMPRPRPYFNPHFDPHPHHWR